MYGAIWSVLLFLLFFKVCGEFLNVYIIWTSDISILGISWSDFKNVLCLPVQRF